MGDIRFSVRQLIADGWAVVPVSPGKKKTHVSWGKDKRFDESNFKADDNVAVLCGAPSGDRTDVDCDAAEAVKAALLLLPTTELVHGRAGKPSSHHWYLCEGVKSEVFKDPTVAKDPNDPRDGMLLEIRSTGGYTVVPPSVWTDKSDGHKEDIEWHSQRAPLRMAKEDLRAAVRNVAAAALLGRHWPGSGAIHDFIGPLTGFLLSTKQLSDVMIYEIIKTAMAIAGDRDVTDRINYAKSTVEKFKAGTPVTGGPKLEERIGDKIVGALRTWFQIKDEDALARFNETHFVTTMGAKAVVGREDIPTGTLFQRPQELYVTYANKKIFVLNKKGQSALMPIFPEWLEWKHRREYRQVVFMPPPFQAEEVDYNLWQGYAVDPDPHGSCELFLNHLRTVICSGNDDHYAFLLNLLAVTVQEPGTPTGVATVLRGGQGAGKGVTVRTIGDMFGRRYFTQLDKVDQLAGKFNSALSGKIIVFADEAFFAGDKREVGALKRLITEPTLRIERKGIDAVDEDNHVHLFMATNEKWSWPAAIDDRRGFLLKVSSARLGDKAYFKELFAEVRNGGVAALLAYLMAYPSDKSLLLEVPKTKERLQQQMLSLEPTMAWWLDILYAGQISPTLGWPKQVPSRVLYELFQQWSTGRRIRIPSQIEFGRQVSRLVSAEKAKINKERFYVVRSLKDARSYWDSVFGTAQEWEDAPENDENLGF